MKEEAWETLPLFYMALFVVGLRFDTLPNPKPKTHVSVKSCFWG